MTTCFGHGGTEATEYFKNCAVRAVLFFADSVVKKEILACARMTAMMGILNMTFRALCAFSLRTLRLKIRKSTLF